MLIESMAVLSTAHITKETDELLEDAWWEDSENMPIVYKKEYGWFIHVDDDYLVEDENGVMVCSYPGVPDDLHACLLKAWEKHCQWLCLDRDASEDEELPTYDWEEASSASAEGGEVA